jgi:transposase-like protein
MDFPIADLMDEGACYQKLVGLLHPAGLCCPGCGAGEASGGLGVHRRRRAPVLDYQCAGCGRVFNAFTGTALHGTRMRPSELVLILRGVATGASTARLARELGRQRPHLLALRHRLQGNAATLLDRSALADAVVEADEMYQNAGGTKASRTATPATRRGGGRTTGGGTAPGTTTARRSSG